MNNIDLRSDTVTRPTSAMREVMATAEVGDDVFGDDPSVLRLQEASAALLGKEAALFVPSGTMANQVALRTHTEPGDEVVLEATSHIYLYEAGGYAALSGISAWCVQGDRGLLTAEQVSGAIRPEGGLSHFPNTSLVCLENSANRGGGTVYSVDRLAQIEGVVRAHGLRFHLDGARVFNAAVAQDVDVATLAAPFDSISFCLSKGLGCPVGSVLVGSRAFIDRAHRFRKMLGGGMRQAGILAAAGLHALENHVARLAEDHRRARRIAEELSDVPGVDVDLSSVQTNMVYIDVTATGLAASHFVSSLAEQGVHLTAVSPTALRAVTHLDVDDAAIEAMLAAFSVAAEAA
ncbi:MAG TPA: low-specificity L-threonine aldolase [Deltaproteobacteria bacterium]|nr:low-specificity L-threonine aldolase [Deltaproteobacteria bacterium]HCP45952.1 low-specificity L-threonine aldolase [Deltaproteobacteria bacterium]